MVGGSIRLLNFANRQSRHFGQLPIPIVLAPAAVSSLNTAVTVQNSHIARLVV